MAPLSGNVNRIPGGAATLYPTVVFEVSPSLLAAVTVKVCRPGLVVSILLPERWLL